MCLKVSADELVRDYIRAMETDNIETVARLSNDGAGLEYPGGVTFNSLESLLKWSKTRHKGIRHAISEVRVVEIDETQAIVYVDGTLHGTWNDGSKFEGIGFIYRFRVSNNRVAHTRLWSDVADRVLKIRNEAVAVS